MTTMAAASISQPRRRPRITGQPHEMADAASTRRRANFTAGAFWTKETIGASSWGWVAVHDRRAFPACRVPGQGEAGTN